jgi:Ras-related protein Rab-8A
VAGSVASPETHRIMAKVVLVGDKAVGKTSLIRRYVLDQFDDRYLLTLGAKVTKKIEDVRIPERNLHAVLELNVWDIMGQAGFRELAKEAYFHGARGILAVADVTRKATLDGIDEWIQSVQDVTGPVPLVLLANKKDLTTQAAVSTAQVARKAESLGCVPFLTSAKTGENVEAAFRQLSTLLVRAYVTH